MSVDENDTPIYNSIADATSDNPTTEDKTPWYQNPDTRRYLYGIAVAAFGILSLYFGAEAVASENWLNLVAAILNLGGSATAELARRNTV